VIENAQNLNFVARFDCFNPVTYVKCNQKKKNHPFFWVKKTLLVDTFSLTGEVLDPNSARCNQKKHINYVFFTKHAKREKSRMTQRNTCKVQEDKPKRDE
jgi:hypothetical protein